MKSFRERLSEEVVPTALSDGSIDINNPAVRAEINGILTAMTSRTTVTPYIALTKIRKALAYFHIELPGKSYLQGDHGVEVWEIHQFGHKMGMTNDGEFVKDVPCKYYLFFHYHLFGSMFMIDARVLDNEELTKRLDSVESMIKEDAACRQAMAKAMSPKEPMHDEDDDGTESTKKAVEVSMRRKDKKLSAGQLDELSKSTLGSYIRKAAYKKPYKSISSVSYDADSGDRQARKIVSKRSKGIDLATQKLTKEESLDEVSMGKLVAYKNKAGEGREKGLAIADKKMKGKAKVNASAPKHPYMEETLDEVSKGAAISAYREKEAQDRDTSKLGGLIKRKWGKETAKHAERAGAQSSVGLIRRGEDRGKEDSIARDKRLGSPARKTKGGKIHKQDTTTLKEIGRAHV